MPANFDGVAGTEEGARRNENHWRDSFLAQRQFLLAQPDNGAEGVNKSAPSFHRLISLLEKAGSHA